MRTTNGLDVPDGWGHTAHRSQPSGKRKPKPEPQPERELVDADELHDLMVEALHALDEATWLIEHSRCKLTDPGLRAQWSLRKQHFLHEMHQAEG